MTDAFTAAATDVNVRAAVYAGTGEYFCTGGDLVGMLSSALLKPAPALVPGTLRRRVAQSNEAMFELFLGFPKPLVAAVNGPAIGGGATGCALCDAVVASERASFWTPFAQLGVSPEGCSSVVFARRFGEDAARRLLEDCWKASARDALAFGLVDELVREECADARPEGGEMPALLSAARARAAALADAGAPRWCHGEALAELRAVNATESRAVAESLVSVQFLDKMVARAKARGPKGERDARLFGALRATHSVWSVIV